jgi:D-glycero-D-manno-heptose 1,7-bisphosphate phosphatase
MKRASFLDRDGVINRIAREGEYVTRWEEMQILPGVAEAIVRLNRADFRVIVVSNQRCVAKGLITISDLEILHETMCRTLATAKATVDAVYYCPHEKEPACGCRKPAPGMLFDAARTHDIDLYTSWMIGDSQADITAGRSAGCKTALVSENITDTKEEPEIVGVSLLDAVQQILQRDEVLSDHSNTPNIGSHQSPGNDER